MVKDTDYLAKLVNYFKRNLKKGYTYDSLKIALKNQDHSEREIERAYQIAQSEMAQAAPVLKTRPKITYEVVDHSPVYSKPEPEKKSIWKKWFG